jgi:hypothetical protein
MLGMERSFNQNQDVTGSKTNRSQKETKQTASSSLAPKLLPFPERLHSLAKVSQEVDNWEDLSLHVLVSDPTFFPLYQSPHSFVTYLFHQQTNHLLLLAHY